VESKWTKSRELFHRAKKSLAGGVSSPFRASVSVPLYITGGKGSRIYDVDGNSHIDYALAWGPLILGHSHPRLCEAVAKRAAVSHTFGAQHEDEYLVAERIQRLVPCAERIAFASSGTEAVQLALRLARAATGRRLILKFEGHYHGWVDSVLISYHPAGEYIGSYHSPLPVLGSRGQVPNAAENLLVAVWNDPDVLENILAKHPNEVAAVIMEPVLCNSGCLLPAAGYLEKVREISRRYGALLIFDEVITGFRRGLGGAQQHYGVTPDLATLGKALAGGAAVSAIAGSKDIMDLIVDGGVAFGGTFNGNPLALTAARVTLDELSANHGEPLAKANRLGEELMNGIREAAEKYSVPLVVCGFGAAFGIHFTERHNLLHYRETLEDNRDKLGTFLYRMVEEGIYTLPDGRFYVSTAHSEDDVAETLRTVHRIFAGSEFRKQGK
jgi:glutamate-1-semialdehyde 2,1-aminomutase